MRKVLSEAVRSEAMTWAVCVAMVVPMDHPRMFMVDNGWLMGIVRTTEEYRRANDHGYLVIFVDIPRYEPV